MVKRNFKKQAVNWPGLVAKEFRDLVGSLQKPSKPYQVSVINQGLEALGNEELFALRFSQIPAWEVRDRKIVPSQTRTNLYVFVEGIDEKSLRGAEEVLTGLGYQTA